jgi:hypothetical protein
MKSVKKLKKKKSSVSKAKKTGAKPLKKAKTSKTVGTKKSTKTGTGSVSRTKKTSTKISPAEFFALIEKTAYELYEKRGYSHGADQGDWYEAEKIVKARLSK